MRSVATVRRRFAVHLSLILSIIGFEPKVFRCARGMHHDLTR